VDLLSLKIPLDFIESRLGELTWRDVQFGLENELLDPAAVPGVAAAALDQRDPPAGVLELAIAEPGDPVLDEVSRLGQAEPPARFPSERKWLYLVLAWLYERRAELANPLETVEIVYAEFGYPTSITGFVRYMPADEPIPPTLELAEARLMERWAGFLAEERRTLADGAAGELNG
jgi:hypothetical protein